MEKNKRIIHKLILLIQKKTILLHPHFENDYVAQQVEHIPFKDGVLGSNPSMITIIVNNQAVKCKYIQKYIHFSLFTPFFGLNFI